MGIISIRELTDDIQGKLGIWEMNDSYSDLKKKCRLSVKEEKKVDSYTNEKRRCEFLSVRLLLQELLPERMEINYTQTGKPELEQGFHITISHSARLAAVLISDHQAGIDIEQLSRNTEKVAPRFLSETELLHIQKTSSPPLTRILYWCAKEALFKCTPISAIDFKKHILIKPFFPTGDSGKFYGQLKKDTQLVNFVFHYIIFNDHAVVYCTDTDNRLDDTTKEQQTN